MTIRLLSLFSIVLLLVACSGSNEEKTPYSPVSQSTSEQDEKSQYLAYEHNLTVEIEQSELQSQYDSILSMCGNDAKTDCAILESSISIDAYYSQANIQIRIKPEGVDNFSKFASQSGSIKGQSTRVDDLEKEVIDTEKRIRMLTTYRNRLLELEGTQSTDIDSLLKVAKELASVQSQLEHSTGKEQHLSKRINMDILNIFYQTAIDRSFFTPIARATSNFGYELSESISQAITILAYAIPNFLIFIALFIILIKVWKRLK